MALISAAVATIGFTFIYLLLERFPGKDIVEIFEITLGRFLGFIFPALLAFIMTFPYYAAIEITSPMYEMITLIDYGRFLQRVDPIFLFIMSISSLISVSAVFYAFVSIYCKMFRIQDTKPVILSASIITFSVTISSKSMSNVTFGSVQTLRDYGGVLFFILPIIPLIAAKFRKKGGTKNA